MSGQLLTGIRVLDFTQFLAGPLCGQYLADLGAEVIKVENLKAGGDFNRITPPMVEDVSGYFCTINRNKKGISLDLKTEKGKEVFTKLVATADVLLENNRPGVMKRLGFSYEDCRAINPRIIYASVSGFGQTGPYASRPGYDLVAQAMAGSMAITGWPNDPPTRAGIPLADVLAGLNATIGIIGSLYKRIETGIGQQVDVSLLESTIGSEQSLLPQYLIGGKTPSRTGNRYLAAAPYDSFLAKDTYFVLSCGNNPMFQKLCNVLGMPELFDDERFHDPNRRRDNESLLKPYIEEWAKDKTAVECVDILVDAGLPSGPVYDFAQVAKDPHVVERGMFVTIHHNRVGDMTITGNPIKMSEYPVQYKKASPDLGEDNDEIIGGLGYTEDEMTDMRRDGIIG